MLGIIGGSGLYQIAELADTEWREVSTPWGPPSDAILLGKLGGVSVAFLPRHGRGHRVSPTELNSRANIAALKSLGVTQVVSLCAVGSLREDLAPGTFVLVDQFVDRTYARAKSFFGSGLVAHVSMAEPVCARLGHAIAQAAERVRLRLVRGGTYLAMEGPQFSTKAEAALHRSWGMSVIGMTAMPEAKLAREAELCYATVGMVTDYDCWHPSHGHVTVEQVIGVLVANADRARGLVAALVPLLDSTRQPCSQGCDRALDAALITAPDARDRAVVDRLRSVAGRVL